MHIKLYSRVSIIRVLNMDSSIKYGYYDISMNATDNIHILVSC